MDSNGHPATNRNGSFESENVKKSKKKVVLQNGHNLQEEALLSSPLPLSHKIF